MKCQLITQPITMCKFKSGFDGMSAAVFRSFSWPCPDRESHANPLQNLHATLANISCTKIVINKYYAENKKTFIYNFYIAYSIQLTRTDMD